MQDFFKKNSVFHKKSIFLVFFFENICTYQLFFVPLQQI